MRENTIIVCAAPYGLGGLGQHLAWLVETMHKTRGVEYFSPTFEGQPGNVHQVRLRFASFLSRYTPIRLDAGWRMLAFLTEFDWLVARRLSASGREFVGFSGHVKLALERARSQGVARVTLVEPVAHVDETSKRFADAFRAFPFERSWLSNGLRARNLYGYAEADHIEVSSAYARQTFLSRGWSEDRLLIRRLAVDSRFGPPAQRQDAPFHVAFVGALSVAKGIPLLVEAFKELDDPSARLTLVGGSGSSGMHRYLQRAFRADSRIHRIVGDPLPILQSADVLVHPSFIDGFGYAPCEALACGTPVIVTETTGMSEFVRENETGWVIPPGDRASLLLRLRKARSERLAGTRSLLPALVPRRSIDPLD